MLLHKQGRESQVYLLLVQGRKAEGGKAQSQVERPRCGILIAEFLSADCCCSRASQTVVVGGYFSKTHRKFWVTGLCCFSVLSICWAHIASACTVHIP